jgi:nicotinamide riboside kinase
VKFIRKRGLSLSMVKWLHDGFRMKIFCRQRKFFAGRISQALSALQAP